MRKGFSESEIIYLLQFIEVKTSGGVSTRRLARALESATIVITDDASYMAV